MSQVTQEQVMNALRSVMEPELHKDIVSLGMVRDLEVKDGQVSSVPEAGD